MKRMLVALLLGPVLAWWLTGCTSTAPDRGSEAPASDAQQVEAKDSSFTVSVPSDWTSRPEVLAGSDGGQLAVESPDPAVQLLATSFDSIDGAESQAVYSAAGMADSGMRCERKDHASDFGGDRLVIDCEAESKGRTLRTLLIPMVHDQTSVLVLLQVWGDTMSDTVAVVKPILGSWDWS